MISSKLDKSRFDKSKNEKPTYYEESDTEIVSAPRPQETILSQEKILSTKQQAPSNSPNLGAVIGPKISFKGELIGEEDLLIQGKVEGTIDLSNHNLTIGAQGTINANAKAKIIIVEGKVDGDLFGEERILIKSSSEVSGNIVAERVALEDGAKFRGSIDMNSKSNKSSLADKKLEKSS